MPSQSKNNVSTQPEKEKSSKKSAKNQQDKSKHENTNENTNENDSKITESLFEAGEELRGNLKKRIMAAANEQVEKGIEYAKVEIYRLRDKYLEELTVEKILKFIFEKLLNWIKSNIMTFVVAGGTLAYAGAQMSISCDENKKSANPEVFSCPISKVANETELNLFLKKVMEGYFDAFPDDIAFHPDASRELIRSRFKIHDCTVENFKRISNISTNLLAEGRNLSINASDVYPWEYKSYLQAIRFLESYFGYPYMSYKSGLWLLGPNSLCNYKICFFGQVIENTFSNFKPRTAQDVDFIVNSFQDVNRSVHNYINLLNTGIRHGMVRTENECLAGFNALLYYYPGIDKYGANGIEQETYTKMFYEMVYYENIPVDLDEIYLFHYGLIVSDYVKYSLKELVGKSLHALFRYLKEVYSASCRPDGVGPAGLSALPINVVYKNKTVVANISTSPHLPLSHGLCNGTSCRLNGKESYKAILKYYADEDDIKKVNNVGWKMIRKIYPKMIQLAKTFTNKTNWTDAAPDLLRLLGNLTSNFFHDKEFPENESNSHAYEQCVSDKKAQRFCPFRWKAIQNMISYVQSVLNLHATNDVDLFFFNGKLRSTPSCPVKILIDYNPMSSSSSYMEADDKCTRPAYYLVPFFRRRLGPIYEEFSTNGLLLRPGYHNQIQGKSENLKERCESKTTKFFDTFASNPSFSQGWGTYAEGRLLKIKESYSKTEFLLKFGVLKQQMWKALRLVVDTGIHFMEYSSKNVSLLHRRFAWDNSDLDKKEIIRYQSNPGEAVSFVAGQRNILTLRNNLEKKLLKHFDVKEFHYQVMSQGPNLFAYLRYHLEVYAKCKSGNQSENCAYIRQPTKNNFMQDSNEILNLKRPRKIRFS